ncbi:MAG: hypothetical protein ACE15E_14525 [Acidobacteriota bacterium]
MQRITILFMVVLLVLPSSLGYSLAQSDKEPTVLEPIYRVGKRIQSSALVGMNQSEFRELQKALKTELEIARGKVNNDDQAQRVLKLYGAALEVMLDYDFMRDRAEELRAYSKSTRALNPKLFDQSPMAVGLIGLRHEENPGDKNPVLQRLEAIVKKYQLATEKRTFDTEFYKGTYVYVAAGWDARLLSFAGERLADAAGLVESVGHPPPKEIRLGMTVAEVEQLLGLPEAKADLGAKVLYKYEDMTLEFMDGKVVDVKFF